MKALDRKEVVITAFGYARRPGLPGWEWSGTAREGAVRYARSKHGGTRTAVAAAAVVRSS